MKIGEQYDTAKLIHSLLKVISTGMDGSPSYVAATRKFVKREKEWYSNIISEYGNVIHNSITKRRILGAISGSLHDAHSWGFCLNCGRIHMVEPDIAGHPCTICGANKVYDAAEILIQFGRKLTS